MINGNPNQTITNVTLPGGTGSPIGVLPCDATVVTTTTAAVYIQRDAPAGQALWICTMSPTTTYAWIQRPSATATATTAAIGGSVISGVGCASGTVTIPAAVQGVNAAMAVPIGDPGLVNSLVPPSVTATIGAGGVVTVRICNVAGLVSYTPTAVPYKVLVF